VAGALFENQGSRGNGAAMRVAPLGACYAGDPERAVAEAIRSAEVTHMHPEGIAGAVAVALAAARAAHARLSGTRPSPTEFIDSVLHHLSDSETSRSIRRARALLGAATQEAAGELGNGSRVTAEDTVPFTIWVAATHLGDYPAAVATCIEADGDIDTTGAIVGGIVAAHTGSRPGTGVPQWWLTAREPLPGWFDPDRRPPRPRSSAFGHVRRWWSGVS
ncbi:ADP-ribosylglycohydrolase family protein, partial [Nocardia jinanensis]